MKQKHLVARIKQCLVLAELSNCPRAKYGALLLDPVNNIVLMDAYNGGPRGGGDLCAGGYCARNGLTLDELQVFQAWKHNSRYGNAVDPVFEVRVKRNGFVLHTVPKTIIDGIQLTEGGEVVSASAEAHRWAEDFVKTSLPVKSGERVEIGCHHAEMNLVCNCARKGVSMLGGWVIVNGMPCVMCAKLLHHAGIAKVIVVQGVTEARGGSTGEQYLHDHGVEVELRGDRGEEVKR